MPESSPDPLLAPSIRKNSILVKDDLSASKANLSAAHPHFVENVHPHRSPSTSEHNFAVGAHGDAHSTGANAPPSASAPPTGGAGHPTFVDPIHVMGRTPSAMSSSSSIASPSHERSGADRPISERMGTERTVSASGPNERLSNFRFAPAKDVPVGAALAQAQADAQNSVLEASNGRAASPPAEDAPAGVLSGRAVPKQPSDPRIPMDDGKIHILIGVTGSLHVSCIKSIIFKLQSIYGDRVAFQLIVTPAVEKLVDSLARDAPRGNAATPTNQNPANGANPAHQSPANPTNSANPASHLSTPKTSQSPPPHGFKERLAQHNIRVWHDSDEWDSWHGRNDPIIHIELRRWADLLLIAPLSANTLGKIAMGLCDNLLTNVVRAWNAQYPILIAPAMVTYAYNHPATKRQLQLIREEMKWIEILRPTEKVAGSTGGIGMGGMMPWNEIVDRVVQKLGGYPDDDDYDDEDEDEEGEAVRVNDLISRNGDNSSDFDDDDEEDEDDEDAESILNDNYPRNNLSPQGSPL